MLGVKVYGIIKGKKVIENNVNGFRQLRVTMVTNMRGCKWTDL